MAMTINTNVVSINAQRNLSLSGSSLGVSMQRLSSGLRVNSAKDDAAGLAIAERMNAQVRGLGVAARNANDGVSLAQTAEGALGKVGDMLQRMRELAVQAGNATNSKSDRQALQAELDQLRSEVDRVAKTTSFNGQKILDGSFAGGVFQVGANAGDNISVGNLQDVRADRLSAATFGVSSAEVKASSVTAFDKEIAAGDLAIRVGSKEVVKLDAIAAASSGQERLGQVVAAINAKTADTGVTAFLEEGNSGEFTVQLRSSSEDAVSLQGFNAAQTGVGAAVTVGSSVVPAEYADAIDELDGLIKGDATTFAALLTVGPPVAFDTAATPDIDNFDGAFVDPGFDNAYAAFQQAVLGAADGAAIKAESVPDLQKAATELKAALDMSVWKEGATNRADVYSALDSVMTLDVADFNTAVTNIAASDELKALNDALTTAGGTALSGIAQVTTSEQLVEMRNSILSQVDAFMSGSLGMQTAEVQQRTGLNDLDISTQAGAWEAMSKIDSALDQVNSSRAELGALQTRFEMSVANIDIQSENISAARGRIVDADFAKETATLSRSQILQQAGTAMVAQANQLAQGVLQLLQ